MPGLVDPAVRLEDWRGDGPPTVTGDDVVLRPWRPDDVDVVAHAYADPAIQHWHGMSKTPTEAAHWIDGWPARWNAGTGADWAVTVDDVVRGRIGFSNVDLFQGVGTVAYWVLPEARGARVASRALGTLTTWAFTAGLHRVALAHSVHNEPSCRVAQSTGFDLEGTLRRSGRHADGDHDMHLHAKVASSNRLRNAAGTVVGTGCGPCASQPPCSPPSSASSPPSWSAPPRPRPRPPTSGPARATA